MFSNNLARSLFEKFSDEKKTHRSRDLKSIVESPDNNLTSKFSGTNFKQVLTDSNVPTEA